jgi:hypothetical protein
MLAYRGGGSMASIAQQYGVRRAAVSHLLKEAAILVREQRVTGLASGRLPDCTRPAGRARGSVSVLASTQKPSASTRRAH